MGNSPVMNWSNTVDASEFCGEVGRRGSAERERNGNTVSTPYSATNSVKLSF